MNYLIFLLAFLCGVLLTLLIKQRHKIQLLYHDNCIKCDSLQKALFQLRACDQLLDMVDDMRRHEGKEPIKGDYRQMRADIHNFIKKINDMFDKKI